MSECAFLSFDDFPEPLNKLFHPRSLFGMHHEKSFIKCHRSYPPQVILSCILNIALVVYNEARAPGYTAPWPVVHLPAATIPPRRTRVKLSRRAGPSPAQ